MTVMQTARRNGILGNRSPQLLASRFASESPIMGGALVATPAQQQQAATLGQMLPNAPRFANDKGGGNLPLPMNIGAQGMAADSPQWGVDVNSGAMPGLAQAMPAMKPKRRGIFGSGIRWQDIAGIIGDGLTGNPAFAQAKMRETEKNHQLKLLAEQRARDDAKFLQTRQWQVEDRDLKAKQPDYFMSGRDRVRFDPVSGDSQVVFDAPEDFDNYAAALGLKPGSDEYFQAVEDYVLRGNGPTALTYDKQLDDHRTANDRRLDDYRTGNRIRVRGVPTWSQLNPRPTVKAGGKGAAKPKRPTATGAGGKKVEWDGKAWVPVN